MTSFAGTRNEVIQDGDRKRKGRHFPPPPQWRSKNAPQVLDDVISGLTMLDQRWRRWKWRLEDVETPVKTSYRRLPHPWVMPSCRSLTLLRFKKHLIVSLTQALSKWLSELPACYYAEVISLHMSKVVKNIRLQQAPTLLFFFFLFDFYFFFNCTLQLSRIIVQYSGIVGRNLETNLTPTMTILYCYSKQDELLSCHHKFAAYGRMLQPGSCPAIPRS